MKTTTEQHTHGNSIGAAHATQAVSPVSFLDSLILPTHKELKTAHYRIVADNREARERAGKEFRTSQPGIYAYLPYGPSTLRALAYEHALITSFARHLCAAIEHRFGSVPVLRLEHLRASEIQAKALLADRKNLKRIKGLGAIQFAEGGILGVHYVHGIGINPERNRVQLKVLTLLISFSLAVPETQPGGAVQMGIVNH